MSTVVLFSESLPHGSWAHERKLAAAIIVMTLIIHVTFQLATPLLRPLGTSGLNVATQIFGLITLAIGVQFILGGIQSASPHL